jgi:hypothetical protein
VIALELMNKITWRECCTKALALFQQSGFKTISNSQTVMKWNRHFRIYNTLMPCRLIETKEYQPKLFAVYPEAKIDINIYFSKNLEKINVDGFRSYVLDVIFPKIIADANNNSTDNSAEPLEIADLLTSINLKSLGLATAYKYLRYLGYKFDDTKKSYYNDGPSDLNRLNTDVRLLLITSETSCCVMYGYRFRRNLQFN